MELHEHIDAWLRGRIGYGRLDAPAWYIGDQEACGKNQLADRLGVGHAAPEDTCLEDVQAAHTRLDGALNLFSTHAALQYTWNRLIHAHLLAVGKGLPTRAERRAAQRAWWGCVAVENPAQRVLLAEVCPLPCGSRSEAAWRDLYAGLGREDLVSRTAYERHWRERRRRFLGDLISRHAPKWVVAYGREAATAAELWADGAPWAALEVDGAPWGSIARAGRTLLVRAPHPRRAPALRGWEQLGARLHLENEGWHRPHDHT